MIINHDISINIKKIKQRYITLILYDYKLNTCNKINIMKVNIFKNNDNIRYYLKRKNKYDIKSQIIKHIDKLLNIQVIKENIQYISKDKQYLYYSIHLNDMNYIHNNIHSSIIYIFNNYKDDLNMKENIINNKIYNYDTLLMDKFELQDIIIK